MSRHKIYPDMPSGLKGKERREWFKDNRICRMCFRYIEVDCKSKVCCEICLLKERKRMREKRNKKLKCDNLEFCVEQATKLHLSYGEYMVLKSRGENNENFSCL